MKARPDLTSEESRALVAAFERAIKEIPTVRAVRIGHRARHGASYESLGPDAADYIAMFSLFKAASNCSSVSILFSLLMFSTTLLNCSLLSE